MSWRIRLESDPAITVLVWQRIKRKAVDRHRH